MGTSERKEREKQEMREKILDAAMALFVKDGVEKTSIRRIAKEIEYSPGTIYLYFKDKDQIFFELHTRGFSRFRKEIQQGRFVEDPFERLRFIGRSYLHFAMENPELYDVMFIMRSPMQHLKEDESWGNGLDTFGFLEQTVKECQEKGRMMGDDPLGAAYALWGHVHGLAALLIMNRMEMHEGEPREHIFRAFSFVMDALEK